MSMKKVAVFGNAGGGESTLSRRLAEITGLRLYVLDIIQFRCGRYRPDGRDGGKLPDEEYVPIHREILSQDEWIIDGYGSLPTVWERISAADTLIYIDLPCGPVPNSQGLAAEQPNVGEHPGWLPGDLVLPSGSDAKIPSTRRRGGIIQTGSPPDIAQGN